MANYEAGWEAECVTEWEVRLLNGRLKCQAECGAELKNVRLNTVCESDM